MAYQFDPRFLERPVVNPVSDARIPAVTESALTALVGFIWPERDAAEVIADFRELIAAAQSRIGTRDPARATKELWSERQMVFICYGDHIKTRAPGTAPLLALRDFAREFFPEKTFSDLTMHLLPIYVSPFKDGGFDVTDPFAVNPDMGTWDDVRALRAQKPVAVDFVANHLSVASPWYQAYLRDEAPWNDFFIGFDDPAEVESFERDFLPQIYRPRPHNPLIPVTRPDGSTRWVYMTFSDHQADVNFQNPFVFLKMAEILLFYLLQGVTTVRLDAIPYLWKEWGSDCAHHPRTHALVQLFRLAWDLVNPDAVLLAESMEPLADSRRYLSTKDEDKAHMAYNFAPCGLIPYAHINEDARTFQENLARFGAPGNGTQWAVVCGVTHDSSSMNPCRAPKSVAGTPLLEEAQIDSVAKYFTDHGKAEIVRRAALPAGDPEHLPADFVEQFVRAHGEEPRFMNFKRITDEAGNARNIVYEAATAYGSLWDKDPETIVSALGMAIALPGIPFLYLTTVFGILNDFMYYLKTGNPRELNRGRVYLEDLRRELADSESRTARVFYGMKRLMAARLSHPAFHPDGAFAALSNNQKAVISFLRTDVSESRRVAVVQNVSRAPVAVTISVPDSGGATGGSDLISDREVSLSGGTITVNLAGHEITWLELV